MFENDKKYFIQSNLFKNFVHLFGNLKMKIFSVEKAGFFFDTNQKLKYFLIFHAITTVVQQNIIMYLHGANRWYSDGVKYVE